MRAWRNWRDAPASEAGELRLMGVRLPPPALDRPRKLLATLRVFRKGLVVEFEQYDRRERELDTSRE